MGPVVPPSTPGQSGRDGEAVNGEDREGQHPGTIDDLDTRAVEPAPDELSLFCGFDRRGYSVR